MFLPTVTNDAPMSMSTTFTKPRRSRSVGILRRSPFASNGAIAVSRCRFALQYLDLEPRWQARNLPLSGELPWARMPYASALVKYTRSG